MSAPLVWVDIETTGLDPEEDSILEVGLAVTDADLSMRACTSRIVQPMRRLLDDAEEVVRSMHHRSGLSAELHDGWGQPERQVEATLVEWLRERVEPGASPMCGSSVHFDRRFLHLHMPDLEAMFHYRNIDVSTIKELVARWYVDDGDEPDYEPVRRNQHRAISDLTDSIQELAHYRQHFFR